MSSTRRISLVPALETYPKVVRFAQSVPGRLIILASFALGLFLHGRPWWPELTAILAALTFWPAQRRNLICAGSMYWLFRHTAFHWAIVHAVSQSSGVEAEIDWRVLQPVAIVAALLFSAGFIYVARFKAQFAPMRRPVVFLMASYLLLAGIAASAPLSGVTRVWLWAFLIVLLRFLWFLAYSMIYPENARNPLLAVGQYVPFWYGTATTPNPFPKGAGYLLRIEAKSAEELAVCQLKAIKLLLWAGILTVIYKFFADCIDGASPGPLQALGIQLSFALPSPAQLLADSAAGQAHPWHEISLVLLANFLDDLLLLTIWGHVIIACCRMCGFKALRNTHRPLESTSIADFWNRYFYYFKEVLVDVFFYPTFLRYFKKHPRLRLFAATLAAATFGNLLFHYLRDIEVVARVGLWEALLIKRSYMVYALLLGLGIGVSQLRQKRRAKSEHWFQSRVFRPAIVIGFFCMLSVFEIPGTATIPERFGFLLATFGINVG